MITETSRGCEWCHALLPEPPQTVERVVEKPVVDERAIARAVDKARASWGRDLRTVVDRQLRVVQRSVDALAKAGDGLASSIVGVRGSVSQLGLDLASASEAETTEDSRAEVQVGHTSRTTGANHTSRTTGANHPSVSAVGQHSRAPARPIATSISASTPSLAGDLAPGEQRILDATAELEAFGISPASRAQVGIFAGYDLSGGTPGKYVGRLLAQQLAAVRGTGQLALTDAGRARARWPEAALTRAELHRRALDRLSDGERKILQHLLDIYPAAETRAEVGAAVGYNLSGGTPGKYVGKLVTLRFVDIPGTGQLKAGALLFPGGL
jgi:hypothetical protein